MNTRQLDGYDTCLSTGKNGGERRFTYHILIFQTAFALGASRDSRGLTSATMIRESRSIARVGGA